MTFTIVDRIVGCLHGIALGDAVGAAAPEGPEVAGAAVGGLVSGASQPRQCTYRYPSGYSYVAPCQ